MTFTEEGMILMQDLVVVREHVFVCVLRVAIPFILDIRLVDVPARVTQKEDHTGLLHLPAAVHAFFFSR